MKKLGIEIEFTGCTREDIVDALEKLWGSTRRILIGSKTDEPYSYYKVDDKDGFSWTILRDRSVKAEFEGKEIDDNIYACELVSPVLTPQSLSTLFQVIDIIKSVGGKVNETCGIHIHIDKPENFDDLMSLLRKWIIEQQEIYDFFSVADWRREKYCKFYNNFPLVTKFRDEDTLMKFMYDKYTEKDSEKRTLRYYGLNLHSIYTHNTVEFRIFNGTLDKVEIAKIIDWVLHFCYNINDINDYIPELGKVLYNMM